MTQEVHESQRADTANSLVYEANLRLRDPIYGCMGAILTLQQQVQAMEAELAAVRAEIVRHRYRPAAAAAAASSPVATVLPSSHASQLLAASAASRGLHAAGGRSVGTRAAAASSSSSSAVYAAAASSSTDYSSITNENNVPYFG